MNTGMKPDADPAVTAAALHYASVDHLQGLENEMIRRTAEYLDSRVGRSVLLEDHQVLQKQDMLAYCMFSSRIDSSVTVALGELKQALADAAARHAAADIDNEQCAAIQAAAIAAYQAQMQCCDDVL